MGTRCSVTEIDPTIDELASDEGVRAHLAEYEVAYLISIQRREEELPMTEVGALTEIYGMPHGPCAGFVRQDHHLFAVIRAPEREFRDEAGATAHVRAGIFGGPFLPGPWFLVVPAGDPERRACKVLADALAEAIPEPYEGGTVSVILFEAEAPGAAVEPEQPKAAGSAETAQSAEQVPPTIAGPAIPPEAWAVLAEVLIAAREPEAAVTRVTVEGSRCTLEIDPRSIVKVRRFESELAATPHVLRWTGPPESDAYIVEVALEELPSP